MAASVKIVLEREQSDAATQVSPHFSPPTTGFSITHEGAQGLPQYLRTARFDSMLGVQRTNSLHLSQGRPVHYHPAPPADKWQARRVDPNEWRRDNLDTAYGSLYALKPETVAGQGELPEELSTYRSEVESEYGLGVDQQHKREKSYIRRTALSEPPTVAERLELRRFSEHIMQGYNKPKRRPPPGYGAPRSLRLMQTVETTSDAVELLLRPPSSYNVMPKRQKPVKCDQPRGQMACEFCDVLGPISCNQCIEQTNRRIANDVEGAAFPAVDCTAASLVAPTLAQIMARAERSLAKKRVHHGRVDTRPPPAAKRNSVILPPLEPPPKQRSLAAPVRRDYSRPTLMRKWEQHHNVDHLPPIQASGATPSMDSPARFRRLRQGLTGK